MMNMESNGLTMWANAADKDELLSLTDMVEAV